MSDRGSPSAHTGADNSNADGSTPAGVVPAADAAAPVSGDANLSADAPSASGDQVANKDAKKPTLAEVIKTAAELPDDTSGKSTAPAKDGTDKVVDPLADEGAVKTDAEKSAEADKALPFHNHPRWKEVTGQNKQLSEQVATLTPHAEQFRTIQTFMDTNHLNHEEVGEGFVIMAMAKNGDPRVLQRLDDFRNKVALAIGEKLPDDIQAQVDSGAITEASAKELSMARAKLKVTGDEDARRTEAERVRTEEKTATDHRVACQDATNVWMETVRKSDPDIAKKESAIARYSRALMLEQGFPKTAEAAVALAKTAYAQVNRDFADAMPAKVPSKHVPSAPSSNGAIKKPGSLLDVVRQAAGS